MSLSDFVEKACVSLACTGAVALGAAVIHGERTNSVQDAVITTLQRNQSDATDTLKKLDESVRSLDKNVAVLTERLNDQPKNQRK